MTEMNWSALSAIGTIFAAGAMLIAAAVALFLGLWPAWKDRRQRQANASILRVQLLTQLRMIESQIGPRSHPLDVMEREAFDSLQSLWMQAGILEPTELRMINRCGKVLMTFRNRPRVNKQLVNFVQVLINQTCKALEEHPQDVSERRYRSDRP